MILLRHKLLLFLLWALCCFGAQAQNSAIEAKIKRKIFQSCSKSEADVANLSARDRRDLVPYLGRVLELKLAVVTSLAAEAAKIGRTQTLTSTVYPDGSELWKAFDPDHERQAKQCALKILSYVDRTALGEISKILKFALTYQEIGAKKEVDEILVAARKIVKSGLRQTSPDVERRGLSELLELRAETRSNLVDEFILDLAVFYPDLLAEELLNASRDRRLYVVRLFSRLNVDDQEVGNLLVEYFIATNVLVRRDLAAVLAAYDRDDIRIQFVKEIGLQLSRKENLDGEIANSFIFAVKNLPKESLSQLAEVDRSGFEKLFLSGKHAVIFQPLFSKLLEAKLVSREIPSKGLQSSNHETVKVSLQLVDDLVEGRTEFFEELRPLVVVASSEDQPMISNLISISNVSDGKKAELFSDVILSWSKLPVDTRPNGMAWHATKGLLKANPSLKMLGRIVAIFFKDVEVSLKSNSKNLPSGLREQVQAIGAIGGRAFKLVPKALTASKVPEVQEALLKGMISGDNFDQRAISYIKQLNKRGAIHEDLLKSFPESVKVNIVPK